MDIWEDFHDEQRKLWPIGSGGAGNTLGFILAEWRDGRAKKLVSNMPLLRSKAEHPVLAGPFGWQVGEAGNSHPMREPPVDGGPRMRGCSPWRTSPLNGTSPI